MCEPAPAADEDQLRVLGFRATKRVPLRGSIRVTIRDTVRVL